MPGGVGDWGFLEGQLVGAECGVAVGGDDSLEGVEEVGEGLLLADNDGGGPGEGVAVLLDFLADVADGFVAEVTVVEGLRGVFKAEGDEQADRDGEEVDEEVAWAADAVFRRVDVEHGPGVVEMGTA